MSAMAGPNQNDHDYEEAKARAQKVLKDNFLSEPPILAWDLADNYGLVISYSTFKPEHNDISGFIEAKKKTIFVNCLDSMQRKNFTIAHELGHFLLDHLKDSGYDALYRRPIVEQNEKKLESIANCFAANLLVPENILRQYIADYSFATNDQLSRIFCVSPEVIGYRRKDLNLF
jgi:Zn-dependent peptidase ImmA (M78 family)